MDSKNSTPVGDLFPLRNRVCGLVLRDLSAQFTREKSVAIPQNKLRIQQKYHGKCFVLVEVFSTDIGVAHLGEILVSFEEFRIQGVGISLAGALNRMSLLRFASWSIDLND